MASSFDTPLAALTASEIVIFPSIPQPGDIERCAATLDDLHGEPAVAFWKAERRLLADELARCGLSEEMSRERVWSVKAAGQADQVERHQLRALSESRARQGRSRRRL
ncbi:hypothetical protein C9413_24735 [Rhizobium sp. SEMIA 4085]|uniref:DUF6074 family protein n=1 Tax=Rhizobium sp. SEMIA 4085 TaxID=2137761 RepID=UPI0014789FDE|nr:DUF6074 family protein [Rhizobium sp. SEMIA 4085]NNH32540.1 hypothetical protein [Rhizobium sp. SEMIA 4085]